MDRRRVLTLLLLIGLLVASLGCSIGELLVRSPTPVPTATKTPRPTFTPTPQGLVLDQPAPEAEVAAATPTEPPPTPTPEPPTDTPVPPTATPVPPTPTPEPVYVIVQADKVNVRKGPGTGYPVVGQVAKGTRLDIVGKNQQSDWWQVCCLQGQQVWIVDRLVEAKGPVQTVAVAANIPPPPPPTATPRPRKPTATPRPAAPTTPPYIFHPPAQGNFATSNDWLLIQAKIWNRQKTPLCGYRLKVQKVGGGEWISEPSDAHWSTTTALKTWGDWKEVNVKLDTVGTSEQGTNTWRVWVIDGGGKQVSPAAEIHTDANVLRWHYLEFLAR